MQQQLYYLYLLNQNIFEASDDKLISETQSDIIEVNYTKNDGEEKKLSAYSKLVSFEELQRMMDYSLKIITKACEDIENLNITPSPLVVGSDPCESCKFYAICKFDEGCGNYKRAPQSKITEQIFFKEEGGANE